MYKIKIIPVKEGSIKSGHFPKWTFHVASYKKGKFQKFLPQTPELIDELNECLKDTPLSKGAFDSKALPFDEWGEITHDLAQI